MEIEDYYMQIVNRQQTIDHLNKVIQLKEDDEVVKNQELFMTKFTVKVLEGQKEELTQMLEELEMRYDEIITLYDDLEPTLLQLRSENQEIKDKIESNEKDMMALKLIEAKYFELKYRVTKNTSVQTVEDFHHIPHHQPRKLTIRESSNKITNLYEVRGEESLNNETHPLIKSKHTNQSKGTIKKAQSDKVELEQSFNPAIHPDQPMKSNKKESTSEYNQTRESPQVKHVEELKQDQAPSLNPQNNEYQDAIKEEQSDQSQMSDEDSHLPSVFDIKEDASEEIFKQIESGELPDSRIDSAFDIGKEKIQPVKVVVDRSKIKLPASKAKVDIKNLIKVMASK